MGLTVEQHAEIDALLADGEEAYLEETLRKHFAPEFTAGQPVGSYFTDVASIRAVLERASEERGNLHSDDRGELERDGADPGAFAPPESGIRYLKVTAPGRLGIVRTNELPDRTPVLAIRTKTERDRDGKPIPRSFVVPLPPGQELPETTFATIVIGPGDAPGQDVIYTLHPGPPAPMATDQYDLRAAAEGREPTDETIATTLPAAESGYVQYMDAASWLAECERAAPELYASLTDLRREVELHETMRQAVEQGSAGIEPGANSLAD